jgi:hypothetical protein
MRVFIVVLPVYQVCPEWPAAKQIRTDLVGKIIPRYRSLLPMRRHMDDKSGGPLLF